MCFTGFIIFVGFLFLFVCYVPVLYIFIADLTVGICLYVILCLFYLTVGSSILFLLIFFPLVYSAQFYITINYHFKEAVRM